MKYRCVAARVLCSVSMLMVLPVHAHMAGAGGADGYGLETTSVMLEVTGEPLVKVFDEIERQTRFLFLTPADKVKTYGSVSLARGTYTVKEALDRVLKRTPLRYKQKDNYIVIFQSAEGRGRRAGTNDMALVSTGALELSTHESLTGEALKKLVLGFLYSPVSTFQLWQKSC